jgi:hypothetical protein
VPDEQGEALPRIKRARHLITRRTLQGVALPPQWEHTAAAHAHGTVGDEHVEVIRKFLKALPSQVDAITRGQAEQTLAEVATTLDPAALMTAAIHLLAMLHPDGEAPDEQAAKKVGLTLGKQQPDGTSHLSGWVSAKLRAYLEPVIAKFAERDRHLEQPTAESRPEPEAESGAESEPEVESDAADSPTPDEAPTPFADEPHLHRPNRCWTPDGAARPSTPTTPSKPASTSCCARAHSAR